jgi:hypothetical protein
MHRIVRGGLFSAAIGLLAISPLAAQIHLDHARVDYLAQNSHPPIPAGMQLVCLQIPGTGAASSQTCPVVLYQGVTTWVYSFLDNRMAIALVSYDANNNVVRNVQKGGLRYVFDAISSDANQTVTFVGQAQQWVGVPWSELGAGNVQSK